MLILKLNFDFANKAQQILKGFNVSENFIYILRDGVLLIILLLICLIAFYITRYVLLRYLEKIISQTETKWDDILLENKFFSRLSYIIPAAIVIKLIPLTLPYYPGWINFIITFTKIYIVVIVMLALFSLINSLNDIYNQKEISKYQPIKGYLQLLKIIIGIIAVILIVAFIMDKSPLYFLTGLGALSAVLMLVFKDALLGLVAGVQLTANDMVRIGDWITVQKFAADGIVQEVTLTTVKVQNFDNSIVYVPAYNLISDSFINWRGMFESSGRRLKRALYIDITSVRFCDNEMLENLKKYALVKDYIENKQKEIDEYNKQFEIDTSVEINGRRQTNLGIFRAYVENYVKSRNDINKDAPLIVRQLPPSDRGLPLEIYAFTTHVDWALFEKTQSDIFDHLIAALPFFYLRLYQTPTGNDVQSVMKYALGHLNDNIE